MVNKLAPYKNLDTVTEMRRFYEEVIINDLDKYPNLPMGEAYRDYLEWSIRQDSVIETLNYSQFHKVWQAMLSDTSERLAKGEHVRT